MIKAPLIAEILCCDGLLPTSRLYADRTAPFFIAGKAGLSAEAELVTQRLKFPNSESQRPIAPHFRSQRDRFPDTHVLGDCSGEGITGNSSRWQLLSFWLPAAAAAAAAANSQQPQLSPS